MLLPEEQMLLPEEQMLRLAKAAARACRADELDTAASELDQLHEQLAAELGAGHALTSRVRLTLARVERERGNADRASELEGPVSEGEPERTGSADLAALDRALKKLRGCPTPKSNHAADLAEGTLEEELAAARLRLASGRYQEAVPHAERAFSLALQGSDETARVQSAEMLAQVRLLAGDASALEAARAAHRAAIAAGALDAQIASARLIAHAGDLDGAAMALDELAPRVETPALVAELEEARGDLSLLLGAPAAAIQHLGAALQGHRDTAQPEVSIAAVLQLLGDAQRAAGNYPAAASAYGEARLLRSKVLGPDHPETARTLNAIGVLYTDFGNWSQARAEFDQASRIFSKSLGPGHPETRLVAVNRALAGWSARHDEVSARLYEHAVGAWSESLGASHPSVSEAWRNLAWMEIELGHGDRAEALLERALLAQTSSLGESHPSVALTRLARGRLLLRRGKLEPAIEEIQKALAIQRAAFGEQHPSVARAQLQLSRAASAAGDTDTAWRQAREASHTLELHVGRAFGAMTDRERTFLAAQARDVVGALLSVEGAPVQELLVALLPHRDSVMRSIAGQRARAQESDPRMRALLDELRTLRARYAAASIGTSPEMAKRASELGTAIDDLETRTALAGIRREEPDPGQLLFQACERLPHDAALIEFVAYDRSLPGGGAPLASYAALVVQSGCRVTRVDLGEAKVIDDTAETYATAMRDQKSDSAEARAQLAGLLLHPLKQVLGSSKRWFVVPDGSLWGVPFGALPDPENPDRYLLERVTIGYLTSLHELAEAERVSLKDIMRLPLLFGAPDFGSAQDGQAEGPTVLTASGPCRLPPFEPLPGTTRELEEIGALMEGARTVVGAEATKARLLEELKHEPSILHLATHAYFAGLAGCEQPARPGVSGAEDEVEGISPNPLLLSGIALAGANRGTGVDAPGELEAGSSILTAYESSSLDLRETRLVVLSACDTGTGLHQRGQEVQGLRWGFRAAGARALVTSLWRSNDRATRQLMLRLYEALQSEDLPNDVFAGAEALRRAQLERIASDSRLGLKRPLLWSNFVFSGVL